MSSGASNDPVGPSTQTTSSQAASATSASVSSTIQTSASSAPSASASTTSAGSTQASNGQTGNTAGNSAGNSAANQTQSTVNAQASNKPTQQPNTNQPANQPQNAQNGTRTPGKDAKHTSAAGLTHTNAAGTPTAKPKTLGALATKDFSNASKTLATFLQRIKQPDHQARLASITSTQSSASGTLPRATATLPASQSPVSSKATSPMAHEAPEASPQDEPVVGPQGNPVVGPQGSGQVRVSSWSVDSDGVVHASGTADTIGGQTTWIALRACPVGTPFPNLPNGSRPEGCMDQEMLTDGHSGGYDGPDNFPWGGFYAGSHKMFVSGAGYYNIWVFSQTAWGNTRVGPFTVASNYYANGTQVTGTKVTLSYGMPSGWSTPSTQTMDTTRAAAGVYLPGEPNHPSWAVFDGWTLNGTNYSANQYVEFPKSTNASYTVTARWHALPTSVRFNYNLNGMSGSTPSSQEINTTYYGGSITLVSPPSHPAWQVFDGWQVDGRDNVNPGKTYTYPAHDESTHTVTARWHINYTGLSVYYNLNGMPATQPGSQYADTTYNSASLTVGGAPSGIPSWAAFDGWYTNTSGTGTDYQGRTLSLGYQSNASYTLYAKWHALPTNITITYDMGTTGCDKPADQHPDSTGKTGTATTTLAGTPATCPAHTHFDGWTINGTDYAPGGTFTYPRHSTDTYTATARTHTVQAPTNLTAAYHITGTVTLSGTSSVQSGDKITACMTEGTGDTSCHPALTATANNSAWNWTVTFPAADYTTKYGYGHQHHFTAKLTSKNTDSATADLKGTLPWTTLSFDKGASGGTAPGSKDALTDTTANKATFTLPGKGTMTAPANAFPDFTGWSDGTNLWQPGGRDIPTNASGASTDTNGHTTLTLTAQWHTVPAPTGVTATWSHTTGWISFKASGLPTGTTSWQIRYKPNSSQSWWTSPNDTMTPTDTYHTYYSDFTPGDTWTAQVRATANDGSGHTVTSDWSQEITGILPYMDVILKPGEGTGPVTDPHVKGLVDPDDHNAHLTLPNATDKGISGPDGRIFANQWNTSSDGSGTNHASGTDQPIPASEGTPDGQATRLTLYAQWKPQSPAPAAGHCTDGAAGAAGWAQWGTPAGPVSGLAGQNTAAACWVIDGTVLRLSGGTSPDYQSSSDIPWASQSNRITKVSIEGDLTLNKTNDSYSGLFGYGHYYGKFTTLTTRDGGKLRIANQAGRNLFVYAYNLSDIDPSGWDVSQATTFESMFNTTATSLDLSGWKTGNVTTMERMFEGASNLTSLDLSGWDTRKLHNTSAMFSSNNNLADIDLSGWDTTHLNTLDANAMFPKGLKRLRLGPKTRLPDPVDSWYDPFKNVDAAHTWHEWDWVKGHHPADNGPVGTTPLTAGDGTTDTLRKRCESATPQGVYIRDDVNPTWTDLTYNLNGGTADNTLPTQIGAAATGSTPKRDGLAIDTTFKDGQYTTATPTHITGNKPHQLFNGWTIDTTNVTGGTATVSNHTITAPKGAGGTAAITAQWSPTPQATPGTPAVTVTPRTTDQGSAGVSVTATLDAAMPAIDATGDDPAKPAVDAGGTVKICAKPSSQNDDYTSGQCQSKTSTTAGSQTITPDPFALPGSLTGGQATTFPAPGEEYTLSAMYTLTDPQTRNQVDSTATQAGGGLTTGTLPWADTTFDTNDSHGGTGTPPTEAKSFVDTASNKAWASLPNATATMKPEHFVFAGWTATASATNPDQGMGDPASRIIQLDATGATETRTTLYAVWHKLATPTTVTGITRDHMTNTVTITGTATPWTSEDDITLDLVPLDGQDGLTPAGARHATISPTDGHGATLAYDGHTEHPWTITLTPSDLQSGGRYRTVAKLEAHDHAWRDTNADLHVYSEPDEQAQPAIDGYFHHALPLTGGQRTMLIIALTLLGVILTAGSQLARNRRRWHHQ
ncbi:BspA family leucine-rich repeat surface protein [Bifidobacterium sp. ESL0690]|uniref:BspA family leucine-rich repeat surface protein n=1 Tax=Bifidobacterium sp. ESL0690 TaxID=2983214 RepID=UPI0023F929F6|nr:BspA family leucine-rich repeat surface protein [Bifidobacterium sp. ESL0690]WEV46724.1 BspA family leucine-rich repeat surface protein [Bifidobacterium sp. ESL0690]